MPADALTGPYAQQQKMLLYVLPVVFAVGGIAFPIGVLLYWTTSNLWTMGQQFYVIRNNPAPGTPAFAAKQKRDAAKGMKRGVGAGRHRRGGRGGARSRRARPPASSPRSRPASNARRAAPAPSRAPPRARETPHERQTPIRMLASLRFERGPHKMSDDTQTEQPVDEVADEGPRRRRHRRGDRRARGRPGGADEAEEARLQALEREGDVAADYLEELLDIADLDGDLDMDVDGDRAAVSIVGADLSQLVGRPGRGARRTAGADPAGRLPRDRRAVAADAGRLGLPRRPAGPAGGAGSGVGRPRSRRPASASRSTRCRRSSARSCTTRWPRPA